MFPYDDTTDYEKEDNAAEKEELPHASSIVQDFAGVLNNYYYWFWFTGLIYVAIAVGLYLLFPSYSYSEPGVGFMLSLPPMLIGIIIIMSGINIRSAYKSGKTKKLFQALLHIRVFFIIFGILGIIYIINIVLSKTLIA